MSRLIKKSIPITEGATVSAAEGDIRVKGPKGEIVLPLAKGVTVKVDGAEFWVTAAEKAAGANTAMLGTTWALVRNAIEGVTKGFEKTLEIEGVGYRAGVEGKDLVLHLGYALPVRMPIPAAVAITVEKNIIKVAGINKEAVGQAAAEIRALKKPEPYKGKGIHYQGEAIRRKVGKKAGTTA